MRQECLNYKYSYDTVYPATRLIANVGNKMQMCTQRYDRRPNGVGLLVAAYDDQGPHIFQICPSANYFNCKAMSIGSRSQSAKTYLDKYLKEFLSCELPQLIEHGLLALRGTLPNEVNLTEKNVSIAIVGKDTAFKVLTEEENKPYLAGITTTATAGQSGDAPPPPPPGGATTTAAGADADAEATPADPLVAVAMVE